MASEGKRSTVSFQSESSQQRYKQKHKGKTPANIKILDQNTRDKGIRRALSSPVLLTSPTTAYFTDEGQCNNGANGTNPVKAQLSSRDFLLACLNFAWPLKRRSRIQPNALPQHQSTINLAVTSRPGGKPVWEPKDISSPFTHEVHPGPSEGDLKGVIQTYDEMQAKKCAEEWAQDEIKRRSARFSFSAPDLLQGMTDMNTAEVLYEEDTQSGLVKRRNKRMAGVWMTNKIPDFSAEIVKLPAMKKSRTSSAASSTSSLNGREATPLKSGNILKEISTSSAEPKKALPSSRNVSNEHPKSSQEPRKSMMHSHKVSIETPKPLLNPVNLKPRSHDVSNEQVGRLHRAAKQAQGAFVGLFSGFKLYSGNIDFDTVKVPQELRYEGEDGALQFSSIVIHPDFDYKAVTSMKLYFNANDWSFQQDDKYAMGLQFFASRNDHRLRSLEIYIKGSILFTKHNFTLGAGNMRMAYMKQLVGVSDQYRAWRTLYDGTSSPQLLRDYPLPLGKEVKATVRALLEIKGIASVRVFGAMESSLRDEIIATCQIIHKIQPQPHPRTCRIQETGDYVVRVAEPNNFSLPRRAAGSKSLPDVEQTPKARKRRQPLRPPSMHISMPTQFSVPLPAPAPAPLPPPFTGRRLAPTIELTIAKLRPLPPSPKSPPISPRSPMKLISASWMNNAIGEKESTEENYLVGTETAVMADETQTRDSQQDGELIDSSGLDDSMSHLSLSDEDIDVISPLNIPPPLSNAKSEYHFKLPYSAHLFVDQDITVAYDDRDSEPTDKRDSDITFTQLEMFPPLAPFRSFTCTTPLPPEDTLLSTIEQDLDAYLGYLSDSELVKPEPPPVESPRYSLRPRLSSRVSTGLNHFSLSQHNSYLWNNFVANESEKQVINVRGTHLERGGMEDMVRICAHIGENPWNKDEGDRKLLAREGFVGDCVVGWKVIMSEKGWVVERNRL
jgi:hypothetical protein